MHVKLHKRSSYWKISITLVNKLVKCMLSVCSWLTPDDRSGRVFHPPAAPGDVLSVRFHVSLLEVGGESMEVLGAFFANEEKVELCS